MYVFILFIYGIIAPMIDASTNAIIKGMNAFHPKLVILKGVGTHNPLVTSSALRSLRILDDECLTPSICDWFVFIPCVTSYLFCIKAAVAARVIPVLVHPKQWNTIPVINTLSLIIVDVVIFFIVYLFKSRTKIAPTVNGNHSLPNIIDNVFIVFISYLFLNSLGIIIPRCLAYSCGINSLLSSSCILFNKI